MSTDSSLCLWTHWRDDKGLETAVQDYYPNVFEQDPVLVFALAQYESAKLAIDARMRQLLEAEQ